MYSGNHGNGSANHVPFPHSSPPNSAHDILDGNNQDSAITPPPAGGGGGKPAHRPSLPLPMKGMMHKMRVSSIDNEDDQTQLDVKALDADALAGRIGELFQKLLEIEERDGSTDGGCGNSSHTSKEAQSMGLGHLLTGEALLSGQGLGVGGGIAPSQYGGGASVTLRASEVQSLVEEKKRREAERHAAAIVVKEREMFLRAALQLLDQREDGAVEGISTSKTLSKALSKGKSPKTHSDSGVREGMDAIRVGMLKKYSKGSFWNGTGSMVGAYHWQGKAVELKHGAFLYTDDFSLDREYSEVGGTLRYMEDVVAGRVSLLQNNLFGGETKTISLNVDKVFCKPVRIAISDPPNDSTLDGGISIEHRVFELTMLGGTSTDKDNGGKQRLFLAQSKAERDAWIRSINTAVIGSAGDFSLSASTALGPDGEPIGGGSVGGTPLKQFTPPRMGSANAVRNATNKNGLELVQQSQHPRTNGNSKQPCSLAVAGNAPCAGAGGASLSLGMEFLLDDTDNLSIDSTAGLGYGQGPSSVHSPHQGGNVLVAGGDGSMEGAAAPYAEDIAKFISIRMAVTETGSREHYRHLIRRLCGDVNRRSQGLEITVPVFYVKNYLGGNFKMGDKDMLSRQTTLSLNNSQVYKDLTRDHISINGLVVSGAAMGAEGMIGALCRTIVEKAEAIRTILRVSALNEAKNNPGSRVSSIFEEYPNFDLSEGQVLACARDMLVLCGRTQSGGDTYFCVDNMLVSKERGLCFLAPDSSGEIQPLEILVDVVESGRNSNGIGHGTGNANNANNKKSDKSNIDKIEKNDKNSAAAHADKTLSAPSESERASNNNNNNNVNTKEDASHSPESNPNPPSGLLLDRDRDSNLPSNGSNGQGKGAHSHSIAKKHTTNAVGESNKGGNGNNGNNVHFSDEREHQQAQPHSTGSAIGTGGPVVSTARPGRTIGGPHPHTAPSLAIALEGIDIDSATTSPRGSLMSRSGNDENDENDNDNDGSCLGNNGLPHNHSNGNNNGQNNHNNHNNHNAHLQLDPFHDDMSTVSDLTLDTELGFSVDRPSSGSYGKDAVGSAVSLPLQGRPPFQLGPSRPQKHSSNAALLSSGNLSKRNNSTTTTGRDGHEDNGNNNNNNNNSSGSTNSNGETTGEHTSSNQKYKGQSKSDALTNAYHPALKKNGSGNGGSGRDSKHGQEKGSGGGSSDHHDQSSSLSQGKSVFAGIFGGWGSSSQKDKSKGKDEGNVNGKDKSKDGNSPTPTPSKGKRSKNRTSKQGNNAHATTADDAPLKNLVSPRASFSSVFQGMSHLPLHNNMNTDWGDKDSASASGSGLLGGGDGKGKGTGNGKDRNGKSHSKEISKMVDDKDNAPDEVYVPTMCIRVFIRGVSKFRICDMDPQEEGEAVLAHVTGTFQQCFFLKSNCNGRPAMSDRLVNIMVDDVQ